jgi:AraC-like DNA-binding protein
MASRAQSPSIGFTVSADLVRGLIECAVKTGLPADRFTDLAPESHGVPAPLRFAAAHVLRLWDRVLRLSGDPIVGFRMANHAGPRTFGVLGQIVPRCANMYEAFRQAERYCALASQGGRLNVARDASTLSIQVMVEVPPGPVRSTILLWAATNLAFLPERVTGAAARPKMIACSFAAPGAEATRALSTLCPFSFASRETRVSFDQGVGDLAIPSVDADLKALLADVMEQQLAKLGAPGSFEQALRTILREMLNGAMPTLASVCSRVGLSQRTLQRRLADAGTTFQDLLQEVLQDEAEGLLARGDLSQGEIAFMLGYSEVSAFSRAYRGWTGHPPGAVHA